jgi:hypothetical protein
MGSSSPRCSDYGDCGTRIAAGYRTTRSARKLSQHCTKRHAGPLRRSGNLRVMCTPARQSMMGAVGTVCKAVGRYATPVASIRDEMRSTLRSLRAARERGSTVAEGLGHRVVFCGLPTAFRGLPWPTAALFCGPPTRGLLLRPSVTFFCQDSMIAGFPVFNSTLLCFCRMLGGPLSSPQVKKLTLFLQHCQTLGWPRALPAAGRAPSSRPCRGDPAPRRARPWSRIAVMRDSLDAKPLFRGEVDSNCGYARFGISGSPSPRRAAFSDLGFLQPGGPSNASKAPHRAVPRPSSRT